MLIPHSGEESVVISYGILNAKVQKNPLLNQKQRIFFIFNAFHQDYRLLMAAN